MAIHTRYFPGGRTKCLTMSYDDGTHFDRKLIEIFNRYGIRGTFHINSAQLDDGWCVESTEVRDLYEGHEVSAHTCYHHDLTCVADGTVCQEVLKDRERLEGLCQKPVRGMSYPYGTYNDHLLSLLPTLGIEYSRTVENTGKFNLPANFLAWHPTAHHNDNLLELGQRFLDLDWNWQWHLLYVWGHSWEFESRKNWDMIESFCKMMGGKEEIWYATNIEIVDYVNAVRQLRVSVDETLLYNPTAIDVWVGAPDGTVICIAGGKTVQLTAK